MTTPPLRNSMYGYPVVTGLEDARRAIGRDMIAGDGASALRRYAADIDREIQRLYTAGNGDALAVALIALGGYGRYHLCPYSDIDLLVLFGGPVGAAEERFLRDLLHPLWDAGLVVGHQVREAGELATLDGDNPEFLLAVVDARHVAGDASLSHRLRDAADRPRTRARVLGALQELIEARHAQFNTRSISSSPTSRRRRARCATSPPRAPSPRRAIPRSCAATTTPRAWRRPRIFCCASARSCTSSAGATTTCSATSSRRRSPGSSAIRDSRRASRSSR